MPLPFFTKSIVSKDTLKTDNGIMSSPRKKRLYSRSQSNISHCDIQSWLSNIESTTPNQGYFQDTDDRSNPFSRVKFKQSLAQMTLDQLRHHDEAQKEAEDLLNDWVQKSLYDTNLADNDNLHLLDNKGVKEVPCEDYLDIYDSHLDFNEDEALETVLQNMLKKELVPKRVFSNLGLDNSKQQHDPSVKMELRRQQVKENRLKRENITNQRRQEQQMKKEAHLKAYQRIMKEERLRALKHQQEEREIQRQMAAIRRQMLAEKKQSKEKKQEEVPLITDNPHQPTTENTSRENFSDIERPVTMAKMELQMAKYEALKVKQKAMEIQILQRHFMAWTSVLLQKRVSYGKVSALADWKLLLRHWNAWKSLSMQNKMEKEMQVHQQNMREFQRKDKMASEHYIIQLLKKYFWTWQMYLHRERERQRLNQSQKETKEKMEKLLTAAASGKINTANSLSNFETKSRDLTKNNKPDIEKCIKQGKTPNVPRCHSVGNIIECSQLSSVPWKASRQLMDMENSEFSQLVAGTNSETNSSDQKQLSAFLISAGCCRTTTVGCSESAASASTPAYFETTAAAAATTVASVAASNTPVAAADNNTLAIAAADNTPPSAVADNTIITTAAAVNNTNVAADNITITTADNNTNAVAAADDDKTATAAADKTPADDNNAPAVADVDDDDNTTPAAAENVFDITAINPVIQSPGAQQRPLSYSIVTVTDPTTTASSTSSFTLSLIDREQSCCRFCSLCMWVFMMILLLLSLFVVIAVIVITIII